MTKNFLVHLDISAQELAQRGDASPDGHLRPWIARQCGLAESDVREYAILRRSLDARRKPDIRLLYALRVTVADAAPEPQNAVAAPAPDETHWLYQLAKRPDAPQNPLIIGAGPAGMMAAYLLALHGCQPIILDRGGDVDRRSHRVETGAPVAMDLPQRHQARMHSDPEPHGAAVGSGAADIGMLDVPGRGAGPYRRPQGP